MVWLCCSFFLLLVERPIANLTINLPDFFRVSWLSYFEHRTLKEKLFSELGFKSRIPATAFLSGSIMVSFVANQVIFLGACGLIFLVILLLVAPFFKLDYYSIIKPLVNKFLPNYN